MSRLDEMAGANGPSKDDVRYLLEDDEKGAPETRVRISLDGISIGDLIVFFFKCAIALLLIGVPIGIVVLVLSQMGRR